MTLRFWRRRFGLDRFPHSVPAPSDVAEPSQRLRISTKGTKAVGVGHDLQYSALGDGSSVTYIGQQVVVQVLRNDASAMTPEVRRALGRENVAGVIGVNEVREALAVWRPDRPAPTALSFAQLVEWQRELAAETERRPVSTRMAGAVAGLMECTATAEFLAEVFPGALTSGRLSAAARLAGLPRADQAAAPLQDMLENAVFEAQPLAAAPGAVLARIVAALAHLTGTDRADARLTNWASSRGLVVQLSDALDEFASPTSDLRLIISLADIRKSSPGQAEYWLTRDGEPTTGEPLPAAHDLTSVMAVISSALTWAWEKELRENETLDHVDIVAPVSLLTDLMSKPWALEDEPLQTFTLGAKHSVLMRWSGRLSPDPGVPNAGNVAEINDAARKALQAMAACTEPVTWLESSSFLPEAEDDLRRRLATGRMGAAVGFNESVTLDRALPVLLPYAPIVVWPRPGAPVLDDAFRARVRANWHRWPRDFAEAYRSHHASHTAGQCLCDLHAVSHDKTWLNFCRLVIVRTVAAPKETL
ncbi:hypothetical protein ACH40F_51535 [Streptomyces sp. NPDC020794]|uniref:vWA-MoxR associated conflict system protein n=1 Tax=unclassified Streptomyces TaxID=2593676 RepID=UPI0036E017E1